MVGLKLGAIFDKFLKNVNFQKFGSIISKQIRREFAYSEIAFDKFVYEGVLT